MKDFPSCYSEAGVLVADSSPGFGKTAQNLVTCVYRTKLCSRTCHITITWSKNLMGQGFTLGIDGSANQSLCKVDIKPWLFSKKKGSKRLEVDSGRVEIIWDLSSAKFGQGPEPLEDFYVAVMFNREMVLLLGDLNKEAHKKTNTATPSPDALFVSKREHILGKGIYCTKAQFFENGQSHDVAIEREMVGSKDPCLLIRIDNKLVMQIKHLSWKFRGNQTILVDGLPIEVFWDVHNWLFSSTSGSAVFMFQTCLPSENFCSSCHKSDQSLLPWPCPQSLGRTQSPGLGFSLILYAWNYD